MHNNRFSLKFYSTRLFGSTVIGLLPMVWTKNRKPGLVSLDWTKHHGSDLVNQNQNSSTLVLGFRASVQHSYSKTSVRFWLRKPAYTKTEPNQGTRLHKHRSIFHNRTNTRFALVGSVAHHWSLHLCKSLRSTYLKLLIFYKLLLSSSLIFHEVSLLKFPEFFWNSLN